MSWRCFQLSEGIIGLQMTIPQVPWFLLARYFPKVQGLGKDCKTSVSITFSIKSTKYHSVYVLLWRFCVGLWIWGIGSLRD